MRFWVLGRLLNALPHPHAAVHSRLKAILEASNLPLTETKKNLPLAFENTPNVRSTGTALVAIFLTSKSPFPDLFKMGRFRGCSLHQPPFKDFDRPSSVLEVETGETFISCHYVRYTYNLWQALLQTTDLET